MSVETYVQATVDSAGQLHIKTHPGQDITPSKKPEQVGFDKPMVSPDKHQVGWLALYPNCCTSYPIPMTLVIYS
jgi:hypothetical protein